MFPKPPSPQPPELQTPVLQTLYPRIRCPRPLVIGSLACTLLAALATSADAADLSGQWRGRWSSVTTGHQGPVAARARQIDSARYRVVFRGRFLGVIPFRYAMTMQRQGSDGQTAFFQGQKTLGPLMGTFSYQAMVRGGQFYLNYQSRNDRGSFRMTRRSGRGR